MSANGGLQSLPFPVLIGDIGGTNARFALIADANSAMRRLPTVATADHATIDEAIEAGVMARTDLRPRAAVLALAGPIAGERVPLTNNDWTVTPRQTRERFGLDEVILLNDFEAQSLALPELKVDDIQPIGGGAMAPNHTRVVLGPGTGLGVGALVHAHGDWVPVPGEGGHVDLGPRTERDFALWPHIERGPRTKHGARVSAEALLCGSGMVRLYRAIAAAEGKAAVLDSPEAIVAAGLPGNDTLAVETLTLFSTYLGRVAGDLALIFMPYGGVFLAGGISARIAPALQAGAFREAFVDKAPHRAILERMATAIIIQADAGLIGIAAFARAPQRYSVDLAGRRWVKG